jgi:hypothetical protein
MRDGRDRPGRSDTPRPSPKNLQQREAIELRGRAVLSVDPRPPAAYRSIPVDSGLPVFSTRMAWKSLDNFLNPRPGNCNPDSIDVRCRP